MGSIPITMWRKFMKNEQQVVEVVFPNGKKTYSYIGDGNLRTGQHIDNAPVNHYKTGTPYTAPVTVVATHNVFGAEVGDHIGVSGGQVHSIKTGLKFLPSNKAFNEDRNIPEIKGDPSTLEYMSPFSETARQRLMNFKDTNSDFNKQTARNQLLGR